MKLSTGKVAFPIEFDNGDKACIYFNPNDKGMQDRIEKFETSVEERIKKIDVEKYKDKFNDNIELSIDINSSEQLLSMSPEELTSLHNKMNVVNDMEKEYNQAIREELDIVFDSKISDTVFKYCQPFDVVITEDENGEAKREIYIMHFIHWLMIELKKYGSENKSAINKHISKYVK